MESTRPCRGWSGQHRRHDFQRVAVHQQNQIVDVDRRGTVERGKFVKTGPRPLPIVGYWQGKAQNKNIQVHLVRGLEAREIAAQFVVGVKKSRVGQCLAVHVAVHEIESPRKASS